MININSSDTIVFCLFSDSSRRGCGTRTFTRNDGAWIEVGRNRYLFFLFYRLRKNEEIKGGSNEIVTANGVYKWCVDSRRRENFLGHLKHGEIVLRGVDTRWFFFCFSLYSKEGRRRKMDVLISAGFCLSVCVLLQSCLFRE